MPDIFQAYEPNTSQHRPSLQACEACYARKVKCALSDGNDRCRQCTAHGVECRPRSRKRKVTAVDLDQVDQARGPHGERTPTAGRRQSSAIGSWRSFPQTPQGTGYSESSTGHQRTIPLLFATRKALASASPESAAPVHSSRPRNTSFLSRAAILGEDFPGIDHLHGDRNGDDPRLSPSELEVLKLQGAFSLPDLPLRHSLYEAFVERCYPWMPVIDLDTFNVADTFEQSSLLELQAVMLVGAIMRPEICDKAKVKVYYSRVKALVLSGYETDPLKMLSALCLMQWYTSAAPKKVTTDSPRFWNTYAIGLAHQMGLHKAQSKRLDDEALRRRIWFTLCARDCLTSAAHGRPRLLNPADSDLSAPDTSDISNPPDTNANAKLFPAYVEAVGILGDLCQIITRFGRIAENETHTLMDRSRLLLDTLSEELKMLQIDGSQAPYSLHVAQLHIHILTPLIISHRPRSVFAISDSAAPSVTAAFLTYRIFEAIHLRAETKYLGSAFAWHLLVTAIPLMSCIRVPGVGDQASAALDRLEECLETLGEVRPAAANNLKSVKKIRRAVANATYPDRTHQEQSSDLISQAQAHDLLARYGPEASKLLVGITSLLARQSDGGELRPVPNRSTDAPTPGLQPHAISSASASAERTMTDRNMPEVDDGLQNAFNELFQDETLIPANSWMLRDWMDVFPTMVD